jgi:myo-inositol-1(or 4)-monophosphatase
MPEASTKPRDRTRFAKLALVAAETAVAVGDAIAISDTAIVTRKRGRANFATAADHAAENAIIARLRSFDPKIPVLAEERAQKEIATAERQWVVDPIDGTLNFSRGLPFYCVLIAYVEGGRTRAAAIHAPRTRETFVASQGAGATRNGEAIRVSRVARLSEAFAVASLRFGETKKKDSRFATLNATCARLRVIGSAGLEIAYVAMGRFDLFVHEALSPWDVAAPALVGREAGAVVLSLKTGRDAAWNERQVVIANPSLARAALKLLVKPRM